MTIRPGLHLAELTRPILTESCRLPGTFHGDPADQIIVATARDRDAVVVTKDRLIREYEPVSSIWQPTPLVNVTSKVAASLT